MSAVAEEDNEERGREVSEDEDEERKEWGKKIESVCVREKERRSWIGGWGGADCICEIVYVRKI